MPYYDLFTMPKNGELGGVASTTEAFYSYNIGDVHFLSLDSYGEESNLRMYDTAGAQVNWIKADLAANTRKWVIAYWHHPPYTMGSHNSNSETELVNIRENFYRILERNGVDLIICGHSHDYERSYLLKGYYKANPGDPQLNENNFNVNTHTASSSSGKYNGTAIPVLILQV
jgi:3',5'-cyclic AMP phosphodiesterase CpdA